MLTMMVYYLGKHSQTSFLIKLTDMITAVDIKHSSKSVKRRNKKFSNLGVYRQRDHVVHTRGR